MHYVYIIESKRNRSRFYIGVCDDVANCLREHNLKECKATARHVPWRVKTAIYFKDPLKATAFERYLKTGSGRAFAKRHF